jgi:hypothetical protein
VIRTTSPKRSNFRRPIVDLMGRKFGRLSVVAYAGLNKRCAAVWTCECDCGTIKDIAGNALQFGNYVSCGCYKRELIAGRNKQTFVDRSGLRYGHLLALYAIRVNREFIGCVSVIAHRLV